MLYLDNSLCFSWVPCRLSNYGQSLSVIRNIITSFTRYATNFTGMYHMMHDDVRLVSSHTLYRHDRNLQAGPVMLDVVSFVLGVCGQALLS